MVSVCTWAGGTGGTSTVLAGLASERPATGEFVGHQWTATDTGVTTFWNGVSWRPGPWSLKWGRVGAATATATANITGITTEADIAGASVTFAAVAGRRYKATANVPGLFLNGSTSGSVKITLGDNTVLTYAAHFRSTAQGTIPSNATAWYDAVATADVTIKLRVTATSAAQLDISSDHRIKLVVEDDGPSGSAPFTVA